MPFITASDYADWQALVQRIVATPPSPPVPPPTPPPPSGTVYMPPATSLAASGFTWTMGPPNSAGAFLPLRNGVVFSSGMNAAASKLALGSDGTLYAYTGGWQSYGGGWWNNSGPPPA